MRTSPTVSDLLRRYRRAAGLTQEDLAERAGLSVQAISQLERGVRRQPHTETLRRLAEALHVAEDERAALAAAARPPERAGCDPARPAPALLGRAAEVAQLRRLLRRPDRRLVTLTGPPGVGKTRLARHVAQTLQDAFADGAVVVALAPLSDPALVASAIAQALGASTAGGPPAVTALTAALRPRELLLVLDNFEHVPAATPLVRDLLASAPQLRVLVTSRAALHLYDEQEVPVRPLALPAPQQWHNPARLAQCPAVALFVQRARLVRPTFTLTAENAPAVAALCVRLDGLPLALELAAARTKLFPPQALLARLSGASGSSALPELRGGPRDLPARQQTLRETIAWSERLLEPEEQAVLARLSVFAGGCTAEASAAVCAAPGEDAEDVLARLAGLVDHSLLQVVEGPPGRMGREPRFALLETIREYARERLADRGEVAATAARHATYFVALAEAAGEHGEGPGQAVWLDRVEAEHDNLRAALRWLVAHGALEEGARLAQGIAWCAFVRGQGREWRARLEGLLTAMGPGARTAGRARALNAAGFLACTHADPAAARPLYVESVALHRELGDRPGLADALLGLGMAATDAGEEGVARAALGESLALHRELGRPRGAAWSLNYLGKLALQRGAPSEARALLMAALEARRRAGDQHGLAIDLKRLAAAQRAEGRLEGAPLRARLEEVMALQREVGDVANLAFTLVELGLLALDEGKTALAGAHLRESLTLMERRGLVSGIAHVLACVARLAVAEGQPAQAVRLVGAAAALQGADGAALCGAESAVWATWLAPARQALPGAGAATAWAEGQALGLARAIACARRTLRPRKGR